MVPEKPKYEEPELIAQLPITIAVMKHVIEEKSFESHGEIPESPLLPVEDIEELTGHEPTQFEEVESE